MNTNGSKKPVRIRMENTETSSTSKTAKRENSRATGEVISEAQSGNRSRDIRTNSISTSSTKNSLILTGKTRKYARKFTKTSTGGLTVESVDSVLTRSSISRKNFHSKITRLTARTDFPVSTICLRMQPVSENSSARCVTILSKHTMLFL